MRRPYVLLLCLMLVFGAAPSQAQTIVDNPTKMVFTPSPDHNNPNVTGYEVAYFTLGQTAPIDSTIRLVTKAQLVPMATDFELGITKILFGLFELKLRTCAVAAPEGGGGIVCSPWAPADKQARFSPLPPSANRAIQ